VSGMTNHPSLYIKIFLVLLIPMASACQPSQDELLELTLTPESIAPEIGSGTSSSSRDKNGDSNQNDSEQNGSSDDSSYKTGKIIEQLCSSIDENSPCANPYIPVIEGLRIQYSSADDEIVQRIENVSGRGFTLIQEGKDGSSLSTDWECTPEGLKGFTARDQLEELLPGISGGYTDIEIDGVALPANVRVGDSWEMNVRIIVGISQSGVDSRNTIDLEFNFSAVAEEVIDVSAGSFRSLRIDYTSRGVNNLEVTGPTGVYTQQLAVIEGSGSDWYVKCLGRVKSSYKSVVSGIANFTDERSMELTKFSLAE